MPASCRASVQGAPGFRASRRSASCQLRRCLKLSSAPEPQQYGPQSRDWRSAFELCCCTLLCALFCQQIVQGTLLAQVSVLPADQVVRLIARPRTALHAGASLLAPRRCAIPLTAALAFPTCPGTISRHRSHRQLWGPRCAGCLRNAIQIRSTQRFLRP